MLEALCSALGATDGANLIAVLEPVLADKMRPSHACKEAQL